MSPFKRKFEEIQIGDTATIHKKITEEDVNKFVAMTGDNNPLHVDRDYAEKTPFKDIVAHGMLGASFISTLIGTKLPGEGALWVSQSFEFLLPVRLGDDLTISVQVTKKHDRDRLLELDCKILNQSKQTVLTGAGKVRLLETPAEEKAAATIQRSEVALVTGGAGGIGKAICLRLAEDGYKVVVNYRTKGDRAQSIVEAIMAKGGRAMAIEADVSKESQVAALVEKVTGVWGGVDVLVNNASPHISPQSFEQLEWSEIEHHLNVQFKSAFLLCKLIVPLMKAQKFGRIINITSQVLDSSPSPNWTAYALGKASLATFSKYLAAEVGPFGIQVNSVSPGMTDTSLVGDIPEKARMMIARQTPLRRLGNPEDVAGAVAYLASPKTSFVTGETIRVNGGQVML